MTDTTDALELSLKRAQADDARFAASIINAVSEGVVESLFDGLVPGASAEQLLAWAITKGEGPYQLDNILVARVGNDIKGLCFGYASALQTIPPLMETFVGKARLDAVRELLTASVDDAYWVNTLWTHESVRGEGLGGLLLDAAAAVAREAGGTKLALHCWAENDAALGFYRAKGFTEVRRIAVSGAVGERHPAGGVILEKPIGVAA